MFAGIERLPLPDQVAATPWSHSLFMAIIWSVIAALIALYFLHDSRTSIILGLLVFSHWIIDFISQPMTFVVPNSASPLLHPFGGSPSIGLGVWSTELGVFLGEFGSLIIVLAIYLLTWKKLQNEKEIEKKDV